MNILMLNHNVAWRGSFFRAYHWGRHLVRKGHRVTLLTISETRRWGYEVQEREGVQLVKVGDLLPGRLRSGWDPWDVLLRILYTLPRRYDVVHCVDSRPVAVFPALLLHGLRGTSWVLDWGDWWGRGGTIAERSGSWLEKAFAPVETFFEEAFRRRADGNLVLTSALEQRALSLGVARERLVRIPHGADVEDIKPLDQSEARQRLGIATTDPIVGYIGVILPKDGELLLESFRTMCRHSGGVRLFLIGNCNMKVPEDLTRSGQVLATGRISYDELKQYLAACDVMLLPLRDTIANRGRWPSKVGDYLAAGRPVVTCCVGDMESLFADGAAGVLTSDDPADFAEKTLQLLEDEGLRDEMGKNARRLAETRLDWSILADRLEAFYMDVSGHGKTQFKPGRAKGI